MNVPKYAIPIIVIVFLFGGYLLRPAFTQPTTEMSLGEASGKQLVCEVDGLKCKGTANFFTMLFANTPGILSITTYATEHKAVFTYDPSLITPEAIRDIIEQEIPLRDGSSRQVFSVLSMK